MGDRGAGDRRGGWRSSIRDVVLLVVAVEFLAWVIWRADGSRALLEHWPLVAWSAFALYGLVWSVARVYRVAPGRQTLSIAVLIASLLGLVAGPFAYGMARGGFE